jgi:hypothetical protein
MLDNVRYVNLVEWSASCPTTSLELVERFAAAITAR